MDEQKAPVDDFGPDDGSNFIVSNGQAMRAEPAPKAEKAESEPEAPQDGDKPEVKAKTPDKGEKAASEADSGSQDESDDDGDEGALPKGVRDRLARERVKRERLEIELADMRRQQEMADLTKKAAAKRKASEPDAADFDSAEDYQEAKAEWEKDAKPDEGETPPQLPAAVQEAVDDVKEAVYAEDEWLWQKMEELPHLTQDMMLGLADAPDIASAVRALTGDADRAKEIAAMTPGRQRRAVKSLKAESKVETTTKDNSAKAKKKDEPDPAEMKPVNTRRGSNERRLSDPAMSFSEWEQMRNDDDKRNPFGW